MIGACQIFAKLRSQFAHKRSVRCPHSQPHGALADQMNSNQTPIVCGHCKTINYRSNELTCKRCGHYFTFKSQPVELKKGIGSEAFVTVAVASGVATVFGTTAAVLTFVLASAI